MVPQVSLVQLERRETEGSHPMPCRDPRGRKEILVFQECQENLVDQEWMVNLVFKEKRVSRKKEQHTPLRVWFSIKPRKEINIRYLLRVRHANKTEHSKFLFFKNK